MTHIVPHSALRTPRFSFKQFQREDYARTTMHDGAIVGHDTGGGKGLALFVLPALKVGFRRGEAVRSLQPLAPVLIVAPGDLHEQVINEGKEKFHARITLLDSQATFLQLSTVNPVTGARELPPGYYLTSYTQLASNGVEAFPQWTTTADMMRWLHLQESDCEAFHHERGVIYQSQYKRLGAEPEMSAPELEARYRQTRSQFFHMENIRAEVDAAYEQLRRLHGPERDGTYADLDAGQKRWVREEVTKNLYRQARRGIGESRWIAERGTRNAEGIDSALRTPHSAFKLKCLYSPTLADWCQDAFACVVVDEGVKMKGEDTVVGLGLRQMNPAYRYVLTATPIKNRLPDVFRLAWWATGGRPHAHARFPYPDDSGAREEFADEFLVSERNLSAEAKSEANRRYVKRTPHVCNVHRLWKMFAPIILRRRKADFGEDIVQKVRQVVRVPMGKAQMDVYRFHLDGEYQDCKGKPAIGPQLQALRIAAANPASALLKDTGPNGFSLYPDRSTQAASLFRSPHSYTPKLHSVLKLIQQILERGEQVVVFSAFHDSLDGLSHRLNAAGVRHCVLDGRTSQKKRGLVAGQFKLGPLKAYATRTNTGDAPTGFKTSPYPVMLAGVECMAEGHSFHLCNNVILMAYSWAYDKFEQAINRVHRLNSRWDVNVYPVICDFSIDRRLESLIQEKGDAAELVLDGKLALENSAEVNLAELLHTARAEIQAGGKNIPVVDERELEREWPALQMSLARAARTWGRRVEPIQPEPRLVLPVAAPTLTVTMPAKKNPLLARVQQRALNDLPLFALKG